MTRALLDELHMSRPFATPEQEVLVSLVYTADTVAGRFAEFLKGVGLSQPQYNVLRILRGAGEPIACRDVTARMITRLPDITRLVDRLVDAGLVQRKRCTEDRRVVFVSLTRKGRKLVDDLDQPALDEARALLGHLTRKDLAQLASLLDKARGGARRE